MKLTEILQDVRVGEQTVLDIAGEGANKKLTVELRRLLPEEARPPKRRESPPRGHLFLTAESFATYLADFGGENTVVFGDPENEQVSAILDELAQNGFEVVVMKPAPHPLWKPWGEILNAKMPIEAFAEFIQKNRRSVSKPDGRELVHTFSQLRSVLSVEIHRGRGKNAVNGLVVTSKIQGQNKTETVELPDELTLEIPLYVGTEAVEIELDLCVEAQTDGVVYVLVTAGTVAEARVAAFGGMLDEIREGAKAINATVTLGRPAHRAWDYLKELDPK